LAHHATLTGAHCLALSHTSPHPSHRGRFRELDAEFCGALLHLSMMLEPDLLALLLSGAHAAAVFGRFLLDHELAPVDRRLLAEGAARGTSSQHDYGQADGRPSLNASLASAFLSGVLLVRLALLTRTERVFGR
jgi:hypothetical protein